MGNSGLRYATLFANLLLTLVSLLYLTLLVLKERFLPGGFVHGAWGHVQTLVDLLWDGLNLSAEFLFNLIQIKSILIGDEVDCETEMSKPTRTADTMKISLRVLREIEIDNDVDGLDIDTTGKEVRTDEVAANTITEVMEYAVTMRLEHLSMRVEARITKFGDFLGEKLNTICRVTENDRLVDLQLRNGSERLIHTMFLDRQLTLENNVFKQ